MKYVPLILFLFFAQQGKTQAFDSTAHYGDTSITLTLTQRAAIYIGFYVKRDQPNAWVNRQAPTQLKNFIGSGNNLDSIFSVSVKASFIQGLIISLLTGQDEVVQNDRLSIINNSPSIPGYTSLAAQIVAKSAGNSNEKNVSTFILNYYNSQVSALAALRTSLINDIVQWSRN